MLKALHDTNKKPIKKIKILSDKDVPNFLIKKNRIAI